MQYRYYIDETQYDNFWQLKGEIKRRFPNTSFPMDEEAFLAIDWENDYKISVRREEYIPPEPTLDELKARKKQEISTARYNEEVGGYNYNGHIVETDDRSKSLLLACLMEAYVNEAYTVQWKCRNDDYITLNAAQIKGLSSAIGTWVETLFNKEARIIQEIKEATTKEEVEAISW